MSRTQATYPVKNMTCAACATSVENMLKFSEGVQDARVNYAAGFVQVEFDGSQVDFTKMRQQVQAIGYDLSEIYDPDKERKEKQKELRKTEVRFVISLLFTLPVFLLAMVFKNVANSAYWQLGLTLPVIFFAGKNYYISAIKKIRYRQFNMDTLIALGTGSAFTFSLFTTFMPQWFIKNNLEPHIYFESAVVIITFILLGKTIEERAKTGTGKAIEDLLNLQPKTAHLLNNQQEQIVPIDQLKENDLIQIYPGEQIPVDGIIHRGNSHVDESMLTGEPIPSNKRMGDKVSAGTMNQSGSLVVITQKTGYATLLSQIIQQVQEAQGSKAPAQKLADKIAAIFVPTVIGIALLSSLVWLAFGSGIIHAINVFISVLIIACPCALGLATPTAITVGIGKGAKNGILIKDAQAFQTLNNVNMLALDKTGTITEGKPAVSHVIFNPKASVNNLSSVIKSIEAKSEHPIARAILNYFIEQPTVEVVNFNNTPGKGVQANINNEDFYIGKLNWPTESGSDWFKQATTQFKSEANTIVQVSNNKECLALIAVKDPVKHNAKKEIELLHDDGISIVMLTGDGEETAEKIASEVEISQFHASLLPLEKAELIKQYQEDGEVIAMAGDGINDSPALAQANVGIAMSTGADIAIESAQITILKGDISKIRKAVRLAQATTTTIRQNLFWAFFYNIIAIPIAAGVLFPLNGFLLNPMIAGAAMAFSSVTVVLNSIRLKYT